MMDVVIYSLAETPKAWFELYLSDHKRRAMRLRNGSEGSFSLNGSMSASKRTGIVEELIAALEKRFRVTNLTGAMKTSLSQLSLVCLAKDSVQFRADRVCPR